MQRTDSLRTVGLKQWLDTKYADKGGYTQYLAMKLAQEGPARIGRHFGVDSRTVNTWDFYDGVAK